ncbi:MAG: hypothetical protein KGZ30_02390 [Anaplasmataceae bacterium]|nr:hypothetical protein [Anaplasmataceae bacterium]
MDRSQTYELIIVITLIVLLATLANPFGFLMTDMMTTIFLACLLGAFAAFTSFVWKENAHDEREDKHRLIAGRIGFLAGSSILVIAIIIQTLAHNLDYWLVFALGGMALGKTLARLYLGKKG